MEKSAHRSRETGCRSQKNPSNSVSVVVNSSRAEVGHGAYQSQGQKHKEDLGQQNNQQTEENNLGDNAKSSGLVVRDLHCGKSLSIPQSRREYFSKAEIQLR